MNQQAQVEKIFQQATDFRNNGQEQQAIEKYQQAIEVYKQLSDQPKIAECWQMIGVCYKIENKTKKAIKAYQEAIAVFETLNDNLGLGNTYRDIGITFAYKHKYKKSLPYLEKSIQYLKKTDDFIALGITLVKTGLSYIGLQNLNKARKLMSEGLYLIRSAQEEQYNWFMEMTALLNLAGLEFAEKKYTQMITDLWAARALIFYQGEEKGQERRLAQIYGLLAQGYCGVGNTNLGVKFLKHALILLQPMSKEVRDVVYEDFKAQDLIRLIKNKSPQAYESLSEEFNL